MSNNAINIGFKSSVLKHLSLLIGISSVHTGYMIFIQVYCLLKINIHLLRYIEDCAPGADMRFEKFQTCIRQILEKQNGIIAA